MLRHGHIDQDADPHPPTALDIETNPQAAVVGLVFIYNDVTGHEQKLHYDSLHAWWSEYRDLLKQSLKVNDKLYRARLRKIYAHNGASFDHMLIWEALNADEAITDCHPIMQDNMCYGLNIVTRWGTVHLSDSYLLLPSSLADLCRDLHVETPKLPDVDAKTCYLLRDSDPDLFWRYCETDVVALRSCLTALRTILRHEYGYLKALPLTIASLAMQLYRSLLDDDEQIWTPRSKKQQDYEHAAMHGGLCLVLHSGDHQQARRYDVNSMYPSVMIENMYPDDYRVFWSTHIDEKRLGIWKCWWWAPDEKLPPFLYNEHRVAAYTGHNCLTTIEYLYARDHGYRLEVEDGFAYESQGRIFHKYVAKMWALRAQALRSGQDALANICKLLGNALGGKFAEGSWKSRIRQITEDIFAKALDNPHMHFFGDWAVEEYERQPYHQFFGIFAYITAYARLRLMHLMEQAQEGGGYLLSCDTDALVVVGAELPTGQGLGDLKCDFYGLIRIAGKKAYALLGVDPSHADRRVDDVRVKGIRHGALTEPDMARVTAGHTVVAAFDHFTSAADVLFYGKKAGFVSTMARKISWTKGLWDR